MRTRHDKRDTGTKCNTIDYNDITSLDQVIQHDVVKKK